MIALLLEKPKKKMKSPKTKVSSSKRKGKKKEVKTLPPNTLMAMRITSNIKFPNLHLKKRRILKTKIIMPRG